MSKYVLLIFALIISGCTDYDKILRQKDFELGCLKAYDHAISDQGIKFTFSQTQDGISFCHKQSLLID
jgi:hypothetical protein